VNKLTLLLISVLLFSSCTDASERSTGLVNVFLIDAPGDFDQVWVEVLGVELKTIGTRGQDNADAKFFPNDQLIKRVNVAALINTNSFLIGRGELSSGSIVEMELKLGTDNYVIRDGERTNLVLDEGADLSLLLNTALDPGISLDMFIDFDIYRSIIQGEGNSLVLRPRLRAFSSLNTGNIAGGLRPLGEKAIIYAIQNRDTIASTGVDEGTGNFRIRGVNGNYRITIQPLNADFLGDTVNNVNAAPRQTTELGNLTLRPREN
jgi:hypothetical protein